MEVRLISNQVNPPEIMPYPQNVAESVISILKNALGIYKIPGAEVIKVDIHITLPIAAKK